MLILLAAFDNGMVLSLRLCFANLVPKKKLKKRSIIFRKQTEKFS